MAGTAGFRTEHDSMGEVLVPADPPVPVLPGLADGSGPLA